MRRNVEAAQAIQPSGTFNQTIGELPVGVNTLNFVAQDVAGNSTTVTRTVTRYGYIPITTTVRYSYDSLYRLTQANYSSGEVYTYTYDPAGNRLTENSPEGYKTYAYDPAGAHAKVVMLRPAQRAEASPN